MNEKEEMYVLRGQNGTEETIHLIDRVFHIDSYCFFSIVNLETMEVMFGQYLGSFPDEVGEDLKREIIWRDFINGCAHITYPDGYLVDDLYELWENG